jgi:hypothetical protein
VVQPVDLGMEEIFETGEYMIINKHNVKKLKKVIMDDLLVGYTDAMKIIFEIFKKLKCMLRQPNLLYHLFLSISDYPKYYFLVMEAGKLRTYLECPVCFLLPGSEIFTCVNSHKICKCCYNKLHGEEGTKQCPQGILRQCWRTLSLRLSAASQDVGRS